MGEFSRKPRSWLFASQRPSIPSLPPPPSKTRRGHANYHHDNLDLFWSQGFGICPQLPGFEDGYYGNYLYLAKDGNYGGGQNCTFPGGTTVYGNTVWSPTGAVTECGKSLAAYQATGGDPGTTASAYPDDSVVLAIARKLMGLPSA